MALACGQSPGGSASTQPQVCAIEDVVAGDGSCIVPGVPPDGCANGFTYDDNGGCTPILPSADCGEGEMAVPGDTECHAVGAPGDPPACPSGRMAIPGETSCRPVADCGSGKWGSIPVDGTTQYVDGSYTGGSSDGSASKPWTNILNGVKAAASGAIVAVAAGTYLESVSIGGKPIKLWGRCPDMVKIASSTSAALAFAAGAEGSEVHRVALTGHGYGAWIQASGVLVDAVWVQGTAQYGVVANANASVQGSLVEGCGVMGIIANKSVQIAIDASVVRDTTPDATGSYGRGIDINQGDSVTVTRSLLERNREAQLAVAGARVLVDASVFRDGMPGIANTDTGQGIYAYYEVDRPSLRVHASTFERNTLADIYVLGGDATIEDTLVRDMRSPSGSIIQGAAIDGWIDGASKQLASITVASSLVERARTTGILISGGALTVSSCVVRDTLPQEGNGAGGLGVGAQDAPASRVTSTVAVLGSLIERNQVIGVEFSGASGTVDSTVVRGTIGHGIEADDDRGFRPSIAVTQCVLTDNEEVALIGLNSDVVVDRTVVSATRASPQSGNGYALYVGMDLAQPTLASPTLALSNALLADSVGVGLGLWGVSSATVSQTWIRGVVARSDGELGDAVAAFTDTALTASNVRMEGAARAGASMFDTAQVALGNATMACDAIPLDGEGQSAFSAAGPLVCNCNGAASQCQVLSSGLTPPPPVARAPAPH
jgi:hypothetical protein